MRELKPKILFVDDEELARRTFKRIADTEFRVLLAESVDEAIKILEDEHDDIGVLLSDQRMPGKLGVDLLEHCRNKYPKIVRMLTTAYSELEDAIAAVNRGEIMRYIEKPWGNIDGLLIDLRVAMSLFEMRNENEILIAEKLAAGYKTARLDKIRTLITVAACQDYDNKLLAVESLLRQVADVESYLSLPEIDELQNYQVFGQPLTESITGAEIGNYFSNQSANESCADSWEQLITSSSESNINLSPQGNIEGSPSPRLKNIIDSIHVALGNSDSMTGEILSQGEDTLITLKNETSAVSLLSDWLRGSGTNDSLAHRIAALLEAFLLTYHLDGRIYLEFGDEGSIEQVKLRFSNNPSERSVSKNDPGYDWIDDLLILFS